MFEDLSFEIKRKIFHISGLIFPLSYLFLTKFFILIILCLLVAITVIFDTSRHYNPKIRGLIDGFFYKIMRKSEESGTFKLSGVTYMITGLFLSALFFSKELAITSWLILIIADPLATLVGIKIGSEKIHGKTLEGSFAFLFASIFISILSYYFIGYNTNFLGIIISSIMATASEFFSKKINIDDNLLIPLVYGFTSVAFNFFN